MTYASKLDKLEKIKLKDFDPSDHGGLDQDDTRKITQKLNDELGKLQELMYAASMDSVLIVLQGMDTSGKDGTISHVFSAVNPQSCSVASFKQPTPIESAHDFLWRVHAETPPKGHITIFNRSHYEDVLVVRVHKLVPDDVWKARFDQINSFESLLSGSKTLILKFFLNISKDEQERRLLAREGDPEKGWKLSAGDWAERKLWDDYQDAYEDVLSKTSTKDAPWFVVPANHKWYRNLCIAEAIVKAMREHKDHWEAQLGKISVQARADLAKMRAGNSNTDHKKR